VGIEEDKKFTRLMVGAEMQWSDSMSLFLRLQVHRNALSAIETKQLAKQCDIVLPFIKQEEADRFAEIFNQNAAGAIEKNVQRLVNSALKSTLVFGHSILDESINKLLRFIADLNPQAFESDVQKKTVSIEELMSKDRGLLLSTAVDKFLKDSEKASLKKRLELLFKTCPPNSIAFPDELYPEFSFDMARLVHVDAMRHRVVHDLSVDPVEFEDVVYLKYATRMAHKVLAHHHHLKLNEEEVISIFRDLKR
jgi:hypothetical protein